MADSKASAAAPPRPPPATKAARAAAALRWLFPVLVDAMLLCTGAALWALHATNAAAIAARWTCGEGSTAASVADKAARGAFLAVGVLFPLFGPLVFWKIDRPPAPQARESGSGVTRVPSAQRHRPAFLVPLIFMVCSVVVFVGLMIGMRAPANSFLATIGAGFRDIGSFVGSVTICSTFLPKHFVELRA
ncbi:hypothetical protein ACP4OV_005503 [Aristida adscensionis]